MQLQPGPLPSIPDTSTNPTPEDPGNVAFVQEWDPVFDALDQGLDSVIAPTAAIDAALPDDGSDTDIEAVAATLNAFGDPDSTQAIVEGDANVDALSVQMVIAYSVTPTEAFQPVPPQILAPPGGPVIPTPATDQANIKNLSRPGATDFYPGDEYQIEVQLAPAPGGGGEYAGVGVTMYQTQDSTQWPSINLCLTDSQGTLRSVGLMADADVGNWTLLIQPGTGGTPGSVVAQGGAAPQVQLNFSVVPPPGVPWPPPEGSFQPASGLHPVQVVGMPCSANNITVTLQNVDSPDSQNFISGDHWVLTVTGPPLSDVQIWALFNNVPYGSEILGQTDDRGNYQLSGQMTDDYIGAWVENYSVAGQVWSGALVFFVNAAPTQGGGGPI